MAGKIDMKNQNKPASPAAQSDAVDSQPSPVTDEWIDGIAEKETGFEVDDGVQPMSPDGIRRIVRTALSRAQTAPTDGLMVDMVPPATSRDRWMYEQGRLAERDPRTHASAQAAQQDIMRIGADSALLPCPHCESNDVELCGQKSPTGYSWVQCFGCGARTQEWDRFDKSIGHWNRRAVAAQQAQAAGVPEGWAAYVSIVDGQFCKPSRQVSDGTYALIDRCMLAATSSTSQWRQE